MRSVLGGSCQKSTTVNCDPLRASLLATTFGFVSAVVGILLAVAGTLPVSPYITTISFVIYIVCRVIGNRRGRVTRATA